ncbi:MAG: barstar family protein [Pseudomonadota bacterium]|nr:barstar family protein [Pseudomonadota bacterium]MDQ3228968.1 barstar family protein [Pseudomonadota bacterium]
MSDSGFDLGLDDTAQSGVYFVTSPDLGTLDVAARDAGLLVRRIDFGGCSSKATLMLRIGSALDFPSGSGRNWDALNDRLRDLSWLEAEGYMLLIDSVGDLRDAEESDFDMLLEILEEVAGEWAERGTPFWAFLALPESAFEAMESQ